MTKKDQQLIWEALTNQKQKNINESTVGVSGDQQDYLNPDDLVDKIIEEMQSDTLTMFIDTVESLDQSSINEFIKALLITAKSERQFRKAGEDKNDDSDQGPYERFGTRGYFSN
jgi:hypothetical protein